MPVRIESQAEPIPGYRLIERLGGGGFGEVWKAEAPGGLLKAIKFVYGDLDTAGDEGMRAEQELKAMSRVKTVRHPYILSLERFDIVDGQLIIVMELADRNLWDRFKESRAQGLPGIPREELLGYMAETAEALDLMNGEYQLQHLDIKPQNLFLVHNHVKVADFGLVKDLEGMAASVTGGVTPVYAAPETFDGWVSRFCDQYSLAIVYQELLTGQRPFTGNNVRQLIMQHLQGTPNLAPLPPCDHAPIARALAKSPNERFPQCRDLIEALRAGSAPADTQVAPGLQVESDGLCTTTRLPVSLPVVEQAAQITPAEEEVTPHTRKSGLPAEALAPVPVPPADVPEAEPEPHAPWSRREPAPSASEEGGSSSGTRPEVIGDGSLFPALVIGLGQLGLRVLAQLRQNLHTELGSREVLPSLRLLGLDTDPDAVRAASQGRGGGVLDPEEVFLAKLSRPSRYLKSREARAHLDTWMNAKMLYRIPRNPTTTGLRALGRLAFVDNYTLITNRLQTELQACSDLDALTTAARRTLLGLRSNRLRVYVVACLAGGTGGGIFLDLAYTLRQLLRELGHDRPDVVGIFLLPGADRVRARTLSLGNTFAALTELAHFSTPGTLFTARYNDREAPISDRGAPFSRVMLQPLPDTKDEDLLQEITGQTAQYLYRDLATPLGRAADQGRAGLPASGRDEEGRAWQTFGLYRVSWPRAALVRRVARRLCRNLVQRWSSKDAAPVKASAQAWVSELWAQQELGAEHFITRYQAVCAEALGQSPEDLIDSLTRPLVTPENQRPGSAERPEFLALLRENLRQLEHQLGRPEDVTASRTWAQLLEPLDNAVRVVVSEGGQRLAELAVRLIEQPQFRLAGAEEALRQVIAGIEQALLQNEGLNKELASRAAEAHSRLRTFLSPPDPAVPPAQRRAIVTAANLAELLRAYAKWRYQSMVLQKVVWTFVSLRGYLSDQLREINYCRARLVDLQRAFDDDEAEQAAETDHSPGRYFFPNGHRTLEAAAAELLGGVSGGDLEDLDRKVQGLVTRQFTALVHVCLASTNMLKNLERAMQEEAERFVGTRLQGANVAAMYLAQYEQEGDVRGGISSDFAEAAPLLKGTAADGELCILAAPSGPAGDQFRDLACDALSGKELTLATSPTDIVYYREAAVDLSALEQLGPVAYEAYRQMSGVEHCSPHSRIDITEWRMAQ
jgi:serine/threonine protein kinase